MKSHSSLWRRLFCSGTVTREWVAVHRRHHAYANRRGDPHSPVVFGLKRVVLQGYELYAAAACDPTILGRGTPEDWLEREATHCGRCSKLTCRPPARNAREDAPEKHPSYRGSASSTSCELTCPAAVRAILDPSKWLHRPGEILYRTASVPDQD